MKTQGRWDRETDRNVYFLAGNMQRLSHAIETQGSWSRDEDRNTYFLATNLSTQQIDAGATHHYILIAVNEINSNGIDKLVALADRGASILLDSGIFWLTNEHKRAHGISMNEALALPPSEIDGFDDLLAKYLQIVDRLGDKLWGVIELDQGGRDCKRETRAMLHEKGIFPMPVYHPLNDGWEYFDELASTYDRIAIGNVVQADARTRLSLLTTLWERRRKYPDLWVHMLGYTLDATLLGWPVDSCDSSTWLAGVRWVAGTAEYSLLSRAGALGVDFAYRLGSDPSGEAGSHQAVKLGATTMRAATMNYRSFLSESHELFGLEQLPARIKGEPPATPRGANA